MALKWFKKNKDQSDKRKKNRADEVPEEEELDDPEPEYQEQNALRATEEEPEDEDEELTDEMIEKMLEEELGVAVEDDFEAEPTDNAVEVLEAHDPVEVPVEE